MTMSVIITLVANQWDASMSINGTKMSSDSRRDSVVTDGDHRCARFLKDYRKAMRKGEILLSNLNESGDDTKQKITSRWTTAEDLHSWGWRTEQQTVDSNQVHSSVSVCLPIHS